MAPAWGQQKFTLSGYIRDGASGESLPGATLRLKAKTNQGSSANNYGFYSITLTPGTTAPYVETSIALTSWFNPRQ